MKYFFLFFFFTILSLPAFAESNIQTLLVCSCGEPVVYGIYDVNDSELGFITRVDVMTDHDKEVLKDMCKHPEKVTYLWKVEDIKMEMCPLSVSAPQYGNISEVPAIR